MLASTAVPGATLGAGGVMGGGMADAVAAKTVARPVPASAASTAMDGPAERRLGLSAGLAGLADLRAGLAFQNDRMAPAFVSSTIGR